MEVGCCLVRQGKVGPKKKKKRGGGRIGNTKEKSPSVQGIGRRGPTPRLCTTSAGKTAKLSEGGESLSKRAGDALPKKSGGAGSLSAWGGKGGGEAAGGKKISTNRGAKNLISSQATPSRRRG